MASLDEECQVISEIWDHDPMVALSAADPGIVGFDNYGVAATTEKNVVWVGELEGHQVAIKVPRHEPTTRSMSHEREYLQKLSSRRFPQVVANARAPSGYTYPAIEFQKTKMPLYLWLETNRTTRDKVSVIQDLLIACVELENAGILHQDLCPRNVLIDPKHNEVAVIDFEFAQSARDGTQCLGGEGGFAAPEQYLNWLGRCSHRTESFFVGTVLFYAFYPEYLNSRASFPFNAASPRRMPVDCYAAMWALLGDAKEQYTLETRYSATAVLRGWGDLPIPPPYLPVPASNPLPGSAIYPVHDGLSVRCFRKGILVMRGDETVSRYDGLVDVETIGIQCENNTTLIGAAVIESNGTIRLRNMECRRA